MNNKKIIAISIIGLALLCLLFASQRVTTAVAVAQDPPTSTPTRTPTITGTATPSIPDGVYLFSNSDGWNNSDPTPYPPFGDGKWCDDRGCYEFNMPMCYRWILFGRPQAAYTKYLDTSGIVGLPYGGGCSESVYVCNMTSSTKLLNLTASGESTGWSWAFQWLADSNTGRWAPTPESFDNWCAFGPRNTGGQRLQNAQTTLSACSQKTNGGNDAASLSMFACNLEFDTCEQSGGFYSYTLVDAGNTGTNCGPTATPTRTPSPVVTVPTPTPRRGVEIEAREGTPVYEPLLIIGMDETWTPTPTPTATPTTPPTVVPDPTDPPGILNCTIPTPVPVVTVVLSAAGMNALPVDDTFLCEDRAEMNFGAASNLVFDPDCTTLIKWTGLNRYQGRVVTDAKIRLFVLGQPVIGAGSQFYTIYPVLPQTVGNRTISWTELQSTWTYRIPGTDWNTPGARGNGTDISGNLPSGYFSQIAPGWIETSLWRPLVQNWINVPQENHGVAIINDGSAFSAQIASSEWFAAGYRPQLVLTLQ